jgi:hypothetical protein
MGDPGKAAGNLRKHKVSFTEAATVLGDFLGTTASDPTPTTLPANTDTLPSGCPIGADFRWSLMQNAAEGFGSSALEN